MTRRRVWPFPYRLHERLGLLALSLAAPLSLSYADSITESALKAAFIYNFAKFAEWPEALDELSLCVFEDDSLASSLAKLDGKPLGTQHLKVVTLETSQTIAQCQILYLGEEQRDNLPRILQLIGGAPTLTVSDATGFIERGVMIEMSLNQARIEFEIDAAAARRSGLEISGKLLRLAKRVY